MRPRARVSGVAATSSATSTRPPRVWMRATGPCAPPHASASTSSAAAVRVCMVGGRVLRAGSLGGTMVFAVPIVFTLCLVVALGVFVRQLWGRFNLLRAATAVARFDRIPDRIRAVLVYAFGQKMFLRSDVARMGEASSVWMHFFIFWGF